MLAMLAYTVPVFLVIGLGALAARSGLLGDDAVRPLNVFVFYFAMPVLIGGALARQDIASILDPALLAGWLVAGLFVFCLGGLAALALGNRGLGAIAIMGQGAAVGNIGFLALPLVFAVFGEAAAGPLAVALIVDLVVIIPLSIALLEIAGGSTKRDVTSPRERRAAHVIVRRVVTGVVVNPFILSIAVGIALSASGIGLPGAVAHFADFLGAAAGPVALFALGISLAGRRIEGEKSAIAAMTLLKLAVHPLLVWFVLTGPFDVDPVTAGMFAVIAAMPVAGNVFVIASQYGVLVRRSSAAILVSTLVSVATVSAVLAWATAI